MKILKDALAILVSGILDTQAQLWNKLVMKILFNYGNLIGLAVEKVGKLNAQIIMFTNTYSTNRKSILKILIIRNTLKKI